MGMVQKWGVAFCLLTASICVPGFTEGEVTTHWGVVYAQVDGLELALDLAAPASPADPLPIVVILPQNSWGYRIGELFDRRQCRSAVLEVAARGYLAVSFDARPLATLDDEGNPRYPFPCQLEDSRAAIRWLREKAPFYHGDPQKIAAVGLGSGGHLALLIGLMRTPDFAPVQAVVSAAGFSDLARLYEETTSGTIVSSTRDFLGGTPTQRPDAYRAASPITYVTSQAPPILLIQGRSDVTVPFSQTMELWKELKAVGAPVTLIELAENQHNASVQPSHYLDFLDSLLK